MLFFSFCKSRLGPLISGDVVVVVGVGWWRSEAGDGGVGNKSQKDVELISIQITHDSGSAEAGDTTIAALLAAETIPSVRL